MSVYLELTREFNRGERRAILSSGQAVVLHRLAIMSKDGDWILAERDEALAHVLAVLEAHGARYRFGDRWREEWPAVERDIEGLPLREAHAVVVERALALLPFVPGTQGRADRG